jgi:hypothetical protein
MIRKITMSLIALMLVFALVSPVFADDSEPTPQVVDEISDYCTTKPGIHPGIHQLTKIYEMTQDDLVILMDWFCKGYADVGDIRQALRAAVRSNESVTVDELKLLLNIPDEQIAPPVTPDEGEENNGDDDMDDKSDSFYCQADTEKQHPTALRYAEMYKDLLEDKDTNTPEEGDGEEGGEIVASEEGTSEAYDTIMKWFCEENFGFGEIKHALKTASQTEATPDELLSERATMGWGEIWQKHELIGQGKPAKVHPVFGPNGKKNTTQEEGDPVVTSPKDKGKPNKPGK